jgi:hypothetical protein
MKTRWCLTVVAVWSAVGLLGQVLGADPAKGGPKCVFRVPTSYTVTVGERASVCAPVRTVWLWDKDKELAELMFWRDGEAPGGIPIVLEDEMKVFHADLLLSDFEAFYGVLKTEKQLLVTFLCDGSGGYNGIHVSGASDVQTLRKIEEKLLAQEKEKFVKPKIKDKQPKRELPKKMKVADYTVDRNNLVRSAAANAPKFAYFSPVQKSSFDLVKGGVEHLYWEPQITFYIYPMEYQGEGQATDGSWWYVYQETDGPDANWLWYFAMQQTNGKYVIWYDSPTHGKHYFDQNAERFPRVP